MPAPNIVVILTDDQERESLAYMPKVQGGLVAHGLSFENAFCQFPLCCPSRATLMTGQQANNHGIYGNNRRTLGGYSKFKAGENNSLAPWLSSAGYRTGHIGKHLNEYHRFADHIPVGWESWQATATGGFSQYYDWKLNDNGTIRSFGENEEDYSTDVFATLAVAFIKEQDERPFYLEVTPYAPHVSNQAPYAATPAPRHAGQFANIAMLANAARDEDVGPDKPKFLRDIAAGKTHQPDEITRLWRERMESLQAVDDLVADVIRALEAVGKLDNTIIIYTADHGWSNGDHRYMGKNVCYESSLGIPLVIRGPGIPEGAVCRQLVTNADVVATIVELARARPGRKLDGRSLLALSADTDAPWRSAFLIEGLDDHSDTNTRWLGVRTSTRKYVLHDYGDRFEELYDLVDDPHELANKANDPAYAGELKRLRALTQSLKSRSGAECWVPDREAVMSEQGTARERSLAAKVLRTLRKPSRLLNLFGIEKRGASRGARGKNRSPGARRKGSAPGRGLFMSADFVFDGLAVRNRNLSFLEEPRFAEAWAETEKANAEIWPRGVPKVQWRVLTVLAAGRQALLTEGDFVECGVFGGLFSVALCHYLAFDQIPRSFFLFDTFTGIPTETLAGAEREAAMAVNASHYSADVHAIAQRNFSRFPNVRLVRGKLPGTLDALGDRKIAYLSIDLNSATYEMQVIERLWPLLSPGAVVVLDDYGFQRRSDQFEAWNKFAGRVGHPIFQLPTGQGLIFRAWG